MDISRRILLTTAPGLAAGAMIAPAAARTSRSRPSVNAPDVGLQADSTKDQSKALQAALDAAMKSKGNLVIPAGRYIATGLRIDQPIQIVGIPGRTTLVSATEEPILILDNASHVTLNGLAFEGGGKAAATPDGRNGLLNAGRSTDLLIENCEFVNGASSGLSLVECSGRIVGNRIRAIGQSGVFCLDSKGLEISGNHVADIGNNGIQVWTSDQREDGAIVTGNRIERVAAKNGGNGQNGNGINVFRAGNVLVAQNRITDCAFSAVRNNSGLHCQIVNNSCSRMGEVAIFVEFAFEGAVVAGNLIEDAGMGISITNFNEGGRLAVCANNIVRKVAGARSNPDTRPVGIAAEADTVVTGNVVEDAPGVGISLGWGPYCRNLTATNNLVRGCGVGMTASLNKDAGSVLISSNMIAGSVRAAILGMDHNQVMTEDLAKPGAQSYGSLTVRDNLVA
jgi:uncharacterized secreted repeat protein (TIGR03808 family)